MKAKLRCPRCGDRSTLTVTGTATLKIVPDDSSDPDFSFVPVLQEESVAFTEEATMTCDACGYQARAKEFYEAPKKRRKYHIEIDVGFPPLTDNEWEEIEELLTAQLTPGYIASKKVESMLQQNPLTNKHAFSVSSIADPDQEVKA